MTVAPDTLTYQCNYCTVFIDSPVWHCPLCDEHSPDDAMACVSCGYGRNRKRSPAAKLVERMVETAAPDSRVLTYESEVLPFQPTAADYADPYGDNEPELWTTIDHDTGAVVNEQNALVQLDSAWAALAEIRSVREALDLSNRAAAIKYYLKRSDAELAVQNKAAAINLLSRHKAAIMVQEMPKNEGTKSQLSGKTPSGGITVIPPENSTPTLTDLGITKGEAQQLRTLATLDEGEVQSYIATTADKGREVTVSGAMGKAKQKKVDQRREARDEQAQAEPIKPRIDAAPWETWLPAQPPCDLLLTDPPYMTDVENIQQFAATWLPAALAKVKPTGRAYVCIGAYPEELAAYLAADTAGMILAQVLVWTYRNTLGPSPRDDYKLNWQAILYFRGSDAPPLQAPDLNEQFSVIDLNAPDGRLGDRYHAWQKPDALAERLIRHSTVAGDRVIDCFSGTGTFVLAATRLGRIGHGCEPSAEMRAIAQQRGCDAR